MQVSASFIFQIMLCVSKVVWLYMHMKSGVEYIHSRDKRALDILVATPLLPAAKLAAFIARRCFIPKEYSIVHQQLRTGANDDTFLVSKIRTIDPETDEPFPHRLAITFRNLGLDEIVQIPQIIGGQMSMVGPRPLAPEDKMRIYEEVSHDTQGVKLVDTYKATAGGARPGLVSTIGISKHLGENPTAEERMEMDIKDYQDASISFDLQLLGTYIQTAVQGKLHNTRTPQENAVDDSADDLAI